MLSTYCAPAMPAIVGAGQDPVRIHFGLEDLANTRFALGPLPMYELVFGVQSRCWDRALLGSIAPLPELIRPGGVVPDLFSSTESKFVDAVAEVGDRIASASARMKLRTALFNYHRAVLAPEWQRVVQSFEAEVRTRARQAFSDGLGSMLSSLHPAIRWAPPVLHVELAWEGDVHLNGRGLLLVPSVYASRPYATFTAGEQPILFYPAPPVAAPVCLEGALGRTRTEVLRALTIERSTTDLARYVGISLPTASQHATALREAGFVSTHRDGKAVKHRLTQRGWELLN